MEKLLKIQHELKAPKGQKNNFGNYKYRSCEDILEAVKPLLAKYNCTLTIGDELVMVGDRYYIKATATIVDNETPNQKIIITAYAREEEVKKGMDSSQITGASSSYSRKYALNGLFLIDDTKDSDSTNDGSPAEELLGEALALKQKILNATSMGDLTLFTTEINNAKLSGALSPTDIKVLQGAYNVKAKQLVNK